MCLILLQWRPSANDGARLIVAANRDEFFHRPASPLQRWATHPDVLGGIDRGAPIGSTGAPGTWMGISRKGRFAALTNVRSARERSPTALSRGELVSGFLLGSQPPAEYLLQVQAQAERYNGFNLLVGTVCGPEPQLWWFSNRARGAPRKLAAGIYGVSNASLDTPWPKLVRGVAAFSISVASGASPDAMFELLSDDTPAADASLPDTGVPLAWERILSPIFVDSPSYGTRSSQVLTVHPDGRIDYRERNFDRSSPGSPSEITLRAQTVT